MTDDMEHSSNVQQQQQQQQPYRIGMMGAGTVGGGVYEIIMNQLKKNINNNGNSSGSSHRPIIITKLLVRSLDKQRDFIIDPEYTTIITTDPTFFLNDIDCFVEVAGGCGLAKDLMLDAITKYHIPVITANKAALYEYNHDFVHALSISKGSNSNLGIEAAVCGGIPIINILQTAYNNSDTISSICGICNGTTNYILSNMSANPQKVLYTDALQEAQQLGFAEADPTADVEGYDVRAKIAIMAQLAYGIYIPIGSISCTGITQITANDFIIVQDHLSTKYTIKLIGSATTTASNENNDTTTTTKISVTVTPMLVPLQASILGNINGSNNVVQVTSTNLNIGTYIGPGAGRLPTANSIVSDIYRSYNNTLITPFMKKAMSYENITFTIDPNYSAMFYIRIHIVSSSSSLSLDDNNMNATIMNICNTMNIKVQNNTVQQLRLPTTASNSVFYVVMTDGSYLVSTIKSLCATMNEEIPCESILYIPLL